MRRLDKEAQSHIVSKSNKRVMKSCLKCLKLEAPEMAVRFKYAKNYKSLAVEGGRDDYLFWINARNNFFSAA